MGRTAILFSCLIILLSGCQKAEFYSYDIYAMNTFISVHLPAKDDELCNRLHKEADRLEGLFSATRDTSEINTGGPLSQESNELLTLALDVAQKTDGAYDPTCISLTRLWDITNGGYLPTEAEILTALKAVDYSSVVIEDGVLAAKNQLDLGGVAKGYALERSVEMIKQKYDYAMVSYGGNVGVFGQKPDGSLWQIAIKDPLDPTAVAGCIEIAEGYISVSGDYERYFEKDGVRYHHIFDPKSGYPVDNGVHSVAVYTRDGALGDALSTALFVMGCDKAIEFYNSGAYDFEALFVTDNGIKMTKGMEEMFIQ